MKAPKAKISTSKLMTRFPAQKRKLGFQGLSGSKVRIDAGPSPSFRKKFGVMK